jgi:hypothetical protein
VLQGTCQLREHPVVKLFSHLKYFVIRVCRHILNAKTSENLDKNRMLDEIFNYAIT